MTSLDQIRLLVDQVERLPDLPRDRLDGVREYAEDLRLKLQPRRVIRKRHRRLTSPMGANESPHCCFTSAGQGDYMAIPSRLAFESRQRDRGPTMSRCSRAVERP